MSAISDKDQIEQLKTTVAQLESWVKLQETTMEWEIEERCEKKLNAEYQKGRADAAANATSNAPHVMESMVNQLQDHLDIEVPKMLESAIPAKYRSCFSGNIRATPRVSHIIDPSTCTSTIGVRVHIEPRTIAIDHIIGNYY